jgi:hypothetical protein
MLETQDSQEPLEARRRIASHVPEADYVPTSRVLLWKLGYALLTPEEAKQPDLRVVREERLAEVPAREREPIILLTAGRGPHASDPRVVGAVRRPAGLHELYRLIQAALEERPRSVPRVPTSLSARATSEMHRWDLVVQSLSENGCLVTGPKLPPLDTVLELEIELPWGPKVPATAVAAYEQAGSLGLVFHNITLGERNKLGKVVVDLLGRL